MRLPRVRPNPLTLVAGVLLLIGAGTALDRSLQHRKTALVQARAAYLDALTVTRTQLAGLLRKAVADRTLAQSLQWKLDHSVKATLEAKLQQGGLDQLALFDAGCNEIAAASLGRRIADGCPSVGDATRDAKGRGGFFWLESEGHPVLGLATPAASLDAGKDPLVAVAWVRLDEDWLRLQPELKRRIDELGLSLGPEARHDAVVAREGLDAQGRSLAALGTNDALDAFLTRRSLAGAGDASWLWTLLAFGLACTAHAFWRERRAATASRALLDEHARWCEALARASATPGAVDDADLPVATLDRAKRAVEQAIQAKSDALRVLQASHASLETAVRTRDEQLVRAKKRLSELAELDSLALQLERTSSAFLQKMGSLHDRAEDLADALGAAVAERAKLLFNLIMEWQEGVAERGARKFLRSLSETPGAQSDSQTLLDEQLASLAVLAGETCDLAINASLEAHRLVESAAFAAQIASYWRGLAARTEAEPPCASLLDALAEAQSLLRLEPALAGLQFAPRLDAGEAQAMPEAPQTVWTTALYHVFLALAGPTPPQGACLATRLRRDQAKTLLITQIVGLDDAEAAAPRRGERQAYHLEVARAVLAPFDIGLAALPTLDGPFPIALTWTREQETGARAALPERTPRALAASGRATPSHDERTLE